MRQRARADHLKVCYRTNKWTSVFPSSETQGWLVGVRGNKSGKEMKRHRFTSKAVNLRRFISLPNLFPLAPTNRPWVSEDGLTIERENFCYNKLHFEKFFRLWNPFALLQKTLIKTLDLNGHCHHF